jgi:hypothetical protein
VKGWVSTLLPHRFSIGINRPAYQPRYLSNSGRLYFNSLDPLVPQDTNGTGDVYQYEPAGVGGCTGSRPTYTAANAGCVDLISSGTSNQASAFLDASESGKDVFFFTAAKLTGEDVDTRQDVYDAREGGGFPEPARPVVCQGDACQQPATPPNHPTPGTSVIDGPGNLVQCPKGKQLQKGKCVKQKVKRHKKKHHKSSIKKGKKQKNKRTASHNRGGGK